MNNNDTWLQASSSHAAQTLGQNPNTADAGDVVMKKAPSQLLNDLIPLVLPFWVFQQVHRFNISLHVKHPKA